MGRIVGRALAVLLLAGVGAACRRTSTTIRRDSVDDAAPTSVPTSDEWIGTFHLFESGEDREPNLEIRVDQTFAAYTDNSDANTRFSGRWEIRSSGVVALRASSPSEPMSFCSGTSVDVTLAPETGGVVIRGTCVKSWMVPPAREPFVAHYRKGKMCPAGPAGTGVAPVKPCP